jgi:hypothetical protein
LELLLELLLLLLLLQLLLELLLLLLLLLIHSMVLEPGKDRGRLVAKAGRAHSCIPKRSLDRVR